MNTNHQRGIKQRAIGGGPPDDPDGVALPAQPNAGLATQVFVKEPTDRWEFVAAPRPAGKDVETTLHFFALIKCNNSSGYARIYTYDEFPEKLENARATVTNAPSGGYDLSQYWVASYYLTPQDSVVVPTGGSVPSGIATWTQAVKKLTA